LVEARCRRERAIIVDVRRSSVALSLVREPLQHLPPAGAVRLRCSAWERHGGLHGDDDVRDRIEREDGRSHLRHVRVVGRRREPARDDREVGDLEL
jgi:hypothetical protein